MLDKDLYGDYFFTLKIRIKVEMHDILMSP